MHENGKKSYQIFCHRNSKPLTSMDIDIPILLENKHEQNLESELRNIYMTNKFKNVFEYLLA